MEETVRSTLDIVEAAKKEMGIVPIDLPDKVSTPNDLADAGKTVQATPGIFANLKKKRSFKRFIIRVTSKFLDWLMRKEEEKVNAEEEALEKTTLVDSLTPLFKRLNLVLSDKFAKSNDPVIISEEPRAARVEEEKVNNIKKNSSAINKNSELDRVLKELDTANEKYTKFSHPDGTTIITIGDLPPRIFNPTGNEYKQGEETTDRINSYMQKINEAEMLKANQADTVEPTQVSDSATNKKEESKPVVTDADWQQHLTWLSSTVEGGIFPEAKEEQKEKPKTGTTDADWQQYLMPSSPPKDIENTTSVMEKLIAIAESFDKNLKEMNANIKEMIKANKVEDEKLDQILARQNLNIEASRGLAQGLSNLQQQDQLIPDPSVQPQPQHTIGTQN